MEVPFRCVPQNGMSFQKPFEFLMTRVMADIRAALSRCRDAAVSDEDDGSRARHAGAGAMVRLDDESPDRRVEALLWMGTGGSSDASWTERCFNIAFDDPDSVVRGVAWSLIAQLWHDKIQADALRRLARESLVGRFRIAPVSITETVVEMWLDGVRDLRGRAVAGQRRAHFDDDLIKKMAGSDLRAIEQSSDPIGEFFQHPDPNRRIAAVMIGWRKTAEKRQLGDVLERLLVSDPDPGVRITAVRYLTQVHRKTRDDRLGTLLAAIVRDESCHQQLRDTAYQALFEIYDIPVSDWPVTKWSQGGFSFPNDVDWEFVNRCAEGRQP
jgi:hypothetical protein